MTSESVAPATGTAPFVSVAITSYNAEQWLGRALDSVAAQQTGFPVEIVIADDASADGSVAVAKSFQQRSTREVRIIAREKNVGIQRNYFGLFQQCRGKYIAWLDADDYWTDPEKLALQTRVLEEDPTISACAHYARWVTPEGVVKRNVPSQLPGRYGMEEILRGNFLPSLSVMFRNGLQRELPEWYFDMAPLSDWPLWVLAALHGDVLLMDHVMADYQLTPNSHFTGQSQIKRDTADTKFYEHVESIIPRQWWPMVRREKGKRYESLAYVLRKDGQFAASRRAAVKAFTSPAIFDNVASKTKALVAAVVREAQSKI